jgi:uncharacterized protein (DUF58 family)
VLTVVGALITILIGSPEAALLVAPWMVLLTLGLSNARFAPLAATIEIADDRVVIGDDFEVTTSVTGASGSVQVTCMPSDAFRAQNQTENAVNSPVADVLVADRAELRSTLRAAAWGRHDVGRAHIEITQPHGLFRWSGVVTDATLLRVHPTPTQLRNLLAPWLVRRVAGAHRTTARGRGVEFADTRELGPGDSLRDINWRVSARSQQLYVSQRHPDRATDVILLLDSFVESGHDAQRVVGMAIEAAVGLAESHLSVTDRVGLVGLGGVLRWVAPGTGKLQLQQLTDALLTTRLYANATERDLDVIPPRALPPRSFVVALTPLLDDRFINALFLLAGRGHDVAVIECGSAWGEDAARHEDETARLAFRLWKAQRQAVRDRLVDNRISVAEWRPGAHLDIALGQLMRQRTTRARQR